MTDKEKAKAYDEAIERTKKLYGNEIAEEIFSELKESEDERIRRWIIDDIRYNMNNEPLNNSEYKKKAEKAIAWLEKKGKQLADKTEPRFNVGDWVVDNCGYVWKIEGILNQFYLLECVEGGESRPTIDLVDKIFHLWAIQDAKDGDVLACNEEILLFKSYSVLQGRISLYCWYNGHTNNFHSKEVIDILLTTRNKVCPATKEEKQKLFRAIKNKGYKWNAETKILETLIKPKFKVGDRIRYKEANKDDVYEISKVYTDSYGIVGYTFRICMKYQDQYELVPNKPKFDPKTLQPLTEY